MSSPLERAKQSLSIQTVTIRRFNAHIDEDLDLDFISVNEHNIEMGRGVTNIRELSETIEGGLSAYSFLYFSGMRILDPESNSTETDANSYFKIEAIFEAVYSSIEKLDDDILNEFSKHNVGYHVWPYWREFVHSTCGRLGIPLLQVPHYLCPPNPPKSSLPSEKLF